MVLVGRQGNRRVVTAANDLALMLGLRVTMPLAKAQVLVQDLMVRDSDPAKDVEALDRLALWALRHYAPIVAVDPPDGLVINASGAAHLHGGEEAMLYGLIEACAGFGITARATIADTWGAAHAVVRCRRDAVTLIAPGGHGQVLAGMPIPALRLPMAMVDSLRVLGFERIGELSAQPRAPLTLRYGPELGRRLDQAFGRLSEPIDPVRAPDLTEVRRVFAEPIGAAETIAKYTGKLTAQLCDLLESKGLGAKRLDLVFHRVDNRIEAIRVGTARPVRDVKRLTRLLCDKIETVDPGFGIEIMRLTATLAEPLNLKQTANFETEAAADISDLIDILSNRLGAAHVYRLGSVESDVPERSVRHTAPALPDNTPSWPAHWPRPLRLLDRPEPIATLNVLPDYPPRQFVWRGARRRVTRADGPERIFGEWWRRDAEIHAVRDYFRVEDDAGERFWIYRTGDGEDPATGKHDWFLHGIFA